VFVNKRYMVVVLDKVNWNICSSLFALSVGST
jgi:hypothetical protein